MARYMFKNQELREQLSTEKDQLENVTQQCAILKNNVEELEADVEKKTLTIEELERRLIQQSSAHNVEVSLDQHNANYKLGSLSF